MKKYLCPVLVAAVLLFFPFSHSSAQQDKPAGVTLAAPADVVETGILQSLLSEFQKQTDVTAELIPLGSGEFLKIERSNADLLLSDSPLFISKFIKEGYGKSRTPLLGSSLILVGPADDRAGVRKLKSILEAFRRIASTKSTYIARADGSGINVKESDLWRAAGVNTYGQNWLVNSGRKTTETLQIAAARRAYVLTDRANYISWKNRFSLEALVAGDPLLTHVYEIVDVVRPNESGDSRALLDFLRSEKAKDLIRQYGKDKYGTPLYSAP